jgi:hypothetical protein
MPEPVAAIPTVVTDLEDAPESHRRLYTQAEDGTFTLDGGGVLRALEAERAEAKKWKEEAKKYDGFDPDEHKKLKEAAKLADREKDIQRGNFEKVLGEEKQRWQTELEVREQRISKLEGALEGALIDAAATREIAASSGNTRVLLPWVKAQLKLIEHNDQTIAVAIDGKGEPRLKVEPEHAHDFMGPRELVEELKADPEFAVNFKGTGSSGGGAPSLKLSIPGGSTADSEIEKIQQQVKRGQTGRLKA